MGFIPLAEFNNEFESILPLLCCAVRMPPPRGGKGGRGSLWRPRWPCFFPRDRKVEVASNPHDAVERIPLGSSEILCNLKQGGAEVCN